MGKQSCLEKIRCFATPFSTYVSEKKRILDYEKKQAIYSITTYPWKEPASVPFPLQN